MEFEMVELCRRRHGKGLDSIALPSIPSHSLRFRCSLHHHHHELVVVSRGDNTVVPRTGMSLVKICVGFTSSPPPQWCDIAARRLRSSVMQQWCKPVVGWWSCGGDAAGTEEDRLIVVWWVYKWRVQYPPQPEVDFSFPKECYCGGEPLIRTSYTTTDPGRRFYTCENIDDGDCYVHKWWDVAATEEIKAIGTHYTLLSDKVGYVASVSDYESELNQVKDLHYETKLKLAVLEKTISELSKNKSHYELVLGGLVLLVMVISMVVMLK
uniref:GRF-type domain-containing protein n=1 Tax=Brassica oleracea var. oleracea TaxID=109376 RepID=A0A0D3AD10_BRAOL